MSLRFFSLDLSHWLFKSQEIMWWWNEVAGHHIMANLHAHQDITVALAYDNFLTFTLTYFQSVGTEFNWIQSWAQKMVIETYSGPHYMNSLWAHNPNLLQICFVLIWQLMIRSDHKFAHVTSAELSWHVQIGDLIVSPKLKLEQNGLLHYYII